MAAATASREGTDAILEASRSKLKAVDADVKRNEFNVKTADAQVGRIRELVEKEIESVAQLDSAENALTAAKAALVTLEMPGEIQYHSLKMTSE